jgi:hypothetical protein
MIQRIQSIYILLAAVMLAGFLFFPIAELDNIKFQIFELKLTKTLLIKDQPFIILYSKILNIIIRIILGEIILSIFLFKVRITQLKLCVLNIILLLILNVVVLYFLQYYKFESGFRISFKLPFMFPLAGAIFLYLAIRGIRKDENLVKSYDRLR